MKKVFVALMLCLISIISVNAEDVLLSGWISQMMITNSYGQWQTITDNYGNPIGYGDAIIMTNEAVYVRFSHYKPESFMFVEVSDMHYNNSGHQQFTANAYDQDGIPCNLRIVFRDDPNCEAPLQIYVHYANVDYVYNMIVTANHIQEHSGSSNSQSSSYSGGSTI